MEFGLAFSYPFQDKDWLKKVGIAAAVSLIPVIGQIIVLGWSLEVTRRVIQRDPQPLPDWSDFGGHLSRGFQGFVIGLVYALPLIIIVGCQQVLTFGLAAADLDSDTVATVLSVVGICFGCLIFLYAILLNLVLPAAFGNFAASGQLGAGLRVGEVFGLVRAAPAAYLLTLVGVIAAGIIAGIGVIACFIGVYFTLAYSYAISAHLYGQAYNVASAARGMQPAAAAM